MFECQDLLYGEKLKEREEKGYGKLDMLGIRNIIKYFLVIRSV